MSEPLDRGKLLKLTSEVVAAYVSSHRVAPTDLEVIIGSVAGSLAEVGDPPQAVPASPKPAVPVRRSDKEHGVLGLRLLLGDQGAADGHDQGDDAIDPLSALVLGGSGVAGASWAAATLEALQRVRKPRSDTAAAAPPGRRGRGRSP
jgi:ROS/MUCR transcriptional regulator protein